MVDVSGLWEVVGIFLDFLPIVIMILLVALLIGFIIVLFTASGASSKLAKKLNMIVPLVFGLLLLSMVAPSMAAPAKIQAVTLSFDTPIVFSGTIINLQAKGLTQGTELLY